MLADIKEFLKLIDDYANANIEEKRFYYDLIELKYKSIVHSKINTSPKPIMALVTYDDMILKKKVKDLYKYRVRIENLKYREKTLKVNSCRV